MARKCPVIVGHRANSPVWLKRYIKSEVDMVEFDVWYRDGRIGLGHILEDERHVTLRERIARFLLSIHIRRPPRPARLPQILPERVGAWLDLKTRIPPKELEVFRGLLDGRQVAVSTRWHSDIPDIRRSLPGALVFASLDHRPADPVKSARESLADGLSLRFAYIDEDLVNELHSEGLLVAAWTLNDETSIMQAIKMGVDYLITDLPWKAFKYCKRIV